MEYQGPESADLANVCALNIAFLDWLRSCNDVTSMPLTPEVATALKSMRRPQLERLARVPFLLVSYREYDDQRWRALFAERRNGELFRVQRVPDEDVTGIITAGLGFLWQLSKRNPYTARLVSGASLNWCEQLASRTLMDLFACVIPERSLIEPRMIENPDLWRKLLNAGVSARKDVRVAARVSALQTVLTGNPGASYRPLASAACSMPATARRVAERRSR